MLHHGKIENHIENHDQNIRKRFANLYIERDSLIYIKNLLIYIYLFINWRALLNYH